MAEFCRSCTVEQLGLTVDQADELGDLVGLVSQHLQAEDIAEWPWLWWVCEGCGTHSFGDLGERLCDSDHPAATGPAPHAIGTECGTCSAIATANAIASVKARYGRRRSRLSSAVEGDSS